jgi:hypothetical protein
MIRKIIIAGAVLFLLGAHNLLCAQATEPIGTITFVEGICDIARNNQTPSLAGEKEPVYVNDRLRTKSYSKLEVTFADKSVLRLAPESCAVIEEYNLNEQKRRERSRIQLTRGKIEAVISKTSAPDTFLLETPNAKGSVKGSDIFLSYLGGKTGVFVQEGAISILNPSAPEVMTKVVGGNSVLVNLKEAPGETRPIRDTELSYFKRSVQPAFVKKWVPGKGAAQMKGIIVSLSGIVRFYKKGSEDWKEPKLNEPVSEGDKLQTEEAATVKIALSNGNIVVLQPYTEMTFETLRYDSASGNYENTLAITKGRLSAVVERTTKQLTFQVKTPTSVCGVRGTFVEVAVTPPAQEAAAGALAQPTTQAFFEGGSGYLTSFITGETQDVGAGQNALVDNLGNVSEPTATPPEQRNVILQTWTSAQTMDNYSNAEGGAGVGSENQQQPPQTQTELGGTEDLGLPGDEVGDYLDIINTLTFNLPSFIYDQILTGSVNDGYITASGDLHLSLLADHTWIGTTSGTWSGLPNEGGFSIQFSRPGDYVWLDVSTWDSGVWDGTVTSSHLGTNPVLQVGGAMAGTYTDIGGYGDFTGAGAGTWSEHVD